MQRMGFSEAKLSHVYTMASVIAKYITREYPQVKKVFVVGMSSMRQSLEAAGLEVIGADQDILNPDVIIDEQAFDNLEIDQDVGAVVYGIDF